MRRLFRRQPFEHDDPQQLRAFRSNQQHGAQIFFVPVVSIARLQDFVYFAELQEELDNGGYEALLHYLLHEVDLTGFNVRAVPQTEGLRQQRDQSLPPLETWWVELLETGTLWGAHPIEPHRAVSNRYQREIDCGKFVRHVTQNGLYDQARQIEPRPQELHQRAPSRALPEQNGL